MAYTPLPLVAAGDWIDEVFINTYWRDNMAAGVPDVFSAKGQLAVGTGVDTMEVLNAGANNKVLMADSAQATGLKWDFNLVLFTSPRKNSSWDGDNIAVSITTMTANTFNTELPNSARALLLTLTAKWTAVSDSNYCNIYPGGSGGNCVLVRSRVANIFMDVMGLVPLNASGEMAIRVAGAAADVDINVWGYIL
ncbi:MAG: hypothetical protein IT296_10240 [Anaerolineae bacterium]|nr:hypothetical protein [Anaerolineae bacterium]